MNRIPAGFLPRSEATRGIGADGRPLYRVKRPRTFDGLRRQQQRLLGDQTAIDKAVAGAKERRRRKAMKRLVAGRAELNAFEVDNMAKDAGLR